MGKAKESTTAWTVTFDARAVQLRQDGLCGYQWQSGGTTVNMGELMQERDLIQQHLRLHLQQGQARMKTCGSSQIGETVQCGGLGIFEVETLSSTLTNKSKLWKLSSKYAEPFQLLRALVV